MIAKLERIASSDSTTEYFREYRSMSRSTMSEEEVERIQEVERRAHRGARAVENAEETIEMDITTAVRQLYKSSKRKLNHSNNIHDNTED